MSIKQHEPSALTKGRSTATSVSQTAPAILREVQEKVAEMKTRQNNYMEEWPELAYKIDCLCQKEELLDKMNELLMSQALEMRMECSSLEEEINDCTRGRVRSEHPAETSGKPRSSEGESKMQE